MRSVVGRVLQIAGAVTLLAIVAAGGIAYEYWPVLHNMRVLNFSDVTHLDNYQPIEIAEGAPGTHPLALAGAGDESIAPASLAAAQAYSDKNGGLALIVWQGGKIRYEHYTPGVGQDSRLETFSMHKSVVGLVYGAALRDHLIDSLDDPVAKYIAEWRNDSRGAMTIRQLLTMESGLRPPTVQHHDIGVYEIDYGDDVTGAALGEKLAVPPGARFAYNSADTQILGAILDRRLALTGGGDYASYVSRVLLRPLGAGDAHLWLEHRGGDPRFFGYFQIRARDWLRMGILIAQDGKFDDKQVLPAAWIKQMETPSAGNPNYGYQLWIGSPWKPFRSYGPDVPFTVPHAKPYINSDLIFFDGFGGERVYISPARDLVIVRIGTPRFAFDDSVIPNDIAAGLPAPKPAGAPAQNPTGAPAQSPAGAPAKKTDSSAVIYAARFKTMMSGGCVYDTMEPVPGAANAMPLPTAPTPSLSKSALAAATAYAARNNSSAFIVWRHGEIQTQTYFGNTSEETPLVSKSLAKPLTAIVIGRAIALGDIKSLDEKVSDFIPEWRGTPKDAILIRNLLDMRSGLLGQSISPDPNNILNRAYLDPHHDAILINDYPLVDPPGTRFDYANAVSDLVALVIERATRQRYAQFVSTQVLAPVGGMGGALWVDRPGGLAHSGCCILLPAQTWLRLAILLIQNGRWNGQALLPPGYVAAMRQATPQNPYYGLAIYPAAPYTQQRAFGNPDMPGPRVWQSAPFLARDLYMFDGNSDQVVYIIPSQQLIIMRLGAAPPQTPTWDNAILPNLILRAMPNHGPPQPSP